MQLMDAIRARRAVRAYRPDPIPEQVLHRVLEAAIHAPRGGGARNWQFGVVTDAEMRRALAEAAGGQLWIAEAPVVLALCADISWDMADLPEDDFSLRVNYLRFGREFVDFCKGYPDRRSIRLIWANAAPMLPGEHIALAAAEAGLGTCWVGYLDIARASALLRLPEHLACLYLMPIGYPAEPLAPGEPREVEGFIFRNTWA